AAVDIMTGKELWATKARWEVAAADPSGERFIVGDGTGRLYALDARDGNTLWSAPDVAGRVAVDTGRVYVTRDTHLMALNLKNGRKIWDQEFYSNPLGRPTVAGGVVYAPIEDGWLTVRDA